MLLRYPNLVSVRMIAAKKDIAFVDFGDEASSTLAKEALNGHKVGGAAEGEGEPMKVSHTVSRQCLSLARVASRIW